MGDLGVKTPRPVRQGLTLWSVPLRLFWLKRVPFPPHPCPAREANLSQPEEDYTAPPRDDPAPVREAPEVLLS